MRFGDAASDVHEPAVGGIIALGIAAIFLFVYATIWFGSFLDLASTQWLAALALIPLAWAGSAIHLVTRKPNVSTQ